MQMCHHTIVRHKLNENFLQYDHRMNLPCDVIIVLMVIVINFYAITYCTHTYNQLLPSTWWSGQ